MATLQRFLRLYPKPASKLLQLRLELYYCVGPIRPLEREAFTNLEKLSLRGREWQIAQSCSLGSLVIASFGVVGKAAERQVVQIQPTDLSCMYALASHLDPHIRGVEATFSSTGRNQRPNCVSSACRLFCLSFKIGNSSSKLVCTPGSRQGCGYRKLGQPALTTAGVLEIFPDGHAMNRLPCMRCSWQEMGEFGKASNTACVCTPSAAILQAVLLTSRGASSRLQCRAILISAEERERSVATMQGRRRPRRQRKKRGCIPASRLPRLNLSQAAHRAGEKIDSPYCDPLLLEAEHQRKIFRRLL